MHFHLVATRLFGRRARDDNRVMSFSAAINDAWLREIVSRVPLIVLHLWLVGRSFGIVAAHRGIVQHGIYRVIRHPAFARYFLNFAAWLISDSLQLFRIMFEERMLRQNEEYIAYTARVPWRMLPGIF